MNERPDEQPKLFLDRWKSRISEEAVARILGLIATMPNKRDTPLGGDLEGPYDFWFDGGACRTITGWNEFRFQDGTLAQVGSCNPILSVDIRFPDGRRVRVQQEGDLTGVFCTR